MEAICRIGYNTKRVKERTKGYIGEKSISSKSIFKVANVVHVFSNLYSFKFDRRAMLGMTTPIMDTFPPENLIDGLEQWIYGTHTKLLLELLGHSEFTGITAELQKLKAQTLIFLRKIRKLVVRTPNEDMYFECQIVPKDRNLDGGETATLVKESWSAKKCKKTEEKYLIVRQSIPSSVDDERRNGVTSTEIVFAFPVDGWRPSLHAQDSLAFLPINVYGFNVRHALCHNPVWLKLIQMKVSY